jgi:hypothetical protein
MVCPHHHRNHDERHYALGTRFDSNEGRQYSRKCHQQPEWAFELIITGLDNYDYSIKSVLDNYFRKNYVRDGQKLRTLTSSVAALNDRIQKQHAFHLVDHGPAAGDEDHVALEQSRDFWGDKSELRRFKDGRIVESVVWEVTMVDDRFMRQFKAVH